MIDSPDETEPRPEDDPEIAALLNFEPAVRQKRGNGWTPALQKKFIAHLAFTGSPELASQALQKCRHGVQKVYKAKDADGFRAAWDAAVALFKQREADRIERECAGLAGLTPPFVDRRKKRQERIDESASGSHRPPEGELPVLPVICDKCGSQGVAGDEAFADIPYLLAFDPVPRPAHDRLWDPATQRAFVAALAVTGSIERAARSIKRHGFAVEKLRKSRGAREFNEACEAALDVARQRELAKMGGTLAELQSESGGRTRDGQIINEYGEYEDEASVESRADEIRERIFGKLEKLRRRSLAEDVIPYPEKRAAWIVFNGPEEIEAIENGTWKPAQWRVDERPASEGEHND